MKISYPEALRIYGHADPDAGTIHIAVCVLCGHRKWMKTDTKGPNEVVVEPYDPGFQSRHDGCPRCEDVHRRAPEIFNWAVGVREKLLDDLEVPKP